MLQASIFLLVAAATTAFAGKANLLVAKEVVNNAVVQDRDLVIKYTIFNTGNGVATDVTLTDEDVTGGPFETVAGLTPVSFSSIAAGGKVSHSLVVQPTFEIQKFHNFSSAKVSYKASPDDLSEQAGLSSAPGQYKVYAAGEYSKDNAAHLTEWFVFMLIAMIPLGVPYMFIAQAKQESQ